MATGAGGEKVPERDPERDLEQDLERRRGDRDLARERDLERDLDAERRLDLWRDASRTLEDAELDLDAERGQRDLASERERERDLERERERDPDLEGDIVTEGGSRCTRPPRPAPRSARRELPEVCRRQSWPSSPIPSLDSNSTSTPSSSSAAGGAMRGGALRGGALRAASRAAFFAPADVSTCFRMHAWLQHVASCCELVLASVVFFTGIVPT